MIFHTLAFERDPFQQEEKSGIYNPPFNLVLDTKSKTEFLLLHCVHFSFQVSHFL